MTRIVTRTAPLADTEALIRHGVHPVLARLYAARGVRRPDEIDTALARLLAPDLLKGVDEAAALLADAIDNARHMLVVADYDCDGATACAVAVRGLRMFGARIDYLVPNRFEYGYGLTPEIVALAARHASGKPDLLITVDNGIASVEGVEAANALGIDVLVTDHHLPGDALPAARAIVNPNQPGCAFPGKSIAGVGVMFYVLLALRAELRRRGAFGPAAGDARGDASTGASREASRNTRDGSPNQGMAGVARAAGMAGMAATGAAVAASGQTPNQIISRQITGQPGSRAARQPCSQPAVQPASGPDNRTGQITGQAAEQTTEQTTGQAAGRTAEQAERTEPTERTEQAEQTANQAAGQMAGQAVEQVAGQTAAHAVSPANRRADNSLPDNNPPASRTNDWPDNRPYSQPGKQADGQQPAHPALLHPPTRQILPEPRLDGLLDLVALGTVADVVKLDGNNRVLVAQGVRRIRHGRMQPGIAALFRAAGRDARTASGFDLGFALGPRLNAAGRLSDMSVGIECLLTDDVGRAWALAQQLDAMNRERREIEADMQQQALAELSALDFTALAGRATITLFNPAWHQGVIGIVAGRLKEKFHRPAFTFAPANEAGEFVKGSGRSIAGFHLRDAIDLIAKREPGLIVRFGGHAMAAGLTLAASDVLRFANAFEQIGREWLDDDTLARTIETDGDLEDAYFTPQFVDMLDAEVWGQGFPAPLFAGEFDIAAQSLVKERHLKLQLARYSQRPGQRFNAIWFNHTELLPARATLVYRLARDTWNGVTRVQLVVEYAR